MFDCPECGGGRGQWERSITMLEAATVLTADPTLLDPMFSRACHRCGATYDWDVAVTDCGDEGTLPNSQQARLVEAIRDLLEQGAGAEQIEELGSQRFGVKAIFIEDGSEVKDRVRRLLAR